MKRAIAAALTLFCVACGGSGDEPAMEPEATEESSDAPAEASGGNEPPVISQADLEPGDAGASDPLSVEIVANDPDQDRVRLSVEWYRNDELVEDLDDTTAPAGQFARGDRVYAIVYASDARHDVSRQTAVLTIGNAAPEVRRVVITPPRASALDQLQAEAHAVDEDGDGFELTYRWFRNGQPIPDAATLRLSPGLVHRGDTVVVQANASDGDDESGWVASAPVVLANAAPSITTQPNYALSGSGQYSYEVAAKDPDGDSPLRYELVQGPPGMSVDVSSGVVTWRVPADAKGVYPIELAVSDPFGGKTTQSYSLSVDWDEGQKDAKGKKPAPAPAPAASQPHEDGVGLDAGVQVSPPAAKQAAEDGDDDYTDEDQEGEVEEEEF